MSSSSFVLHCSITILGLLAMTEAFNLLPWPTNSGESLKFHQCCRSIGLREETAVVGCKYPPDLDMPLKARLDIRDHFNPYIGCYAAHKDNQACCKRGMESAGVERMLGFCQDLCNGKNPHYKPEIKYYYCGLVEPIISACNKKAWDEREQLRAFFFDATVADLSAPAELSAPADLAPAPESFLLEAAPIQPGQYEDRKFHGCCNAIGLKPKTQATCKYPPPQDMSLDVRFDIYYHFNPWISCYAAHKDNRACCVNGILKKGPAFHQFMFCQDLCNGKNPQYTPSERYYKCLAVEDVISPCNEKAWDLQYPVNEDVLLY